MFARSTLLMMQGMSARRTALQSKFLKQTMMAAPVQQSAAFSALVKPKHAVASHVDSFKEAEDRFSIDIRLASHIHIPFSSETTLRTISDALLQSQENQIEKVRFISLTGSRLPLSEKVGCHKEYPVLLQINDDRLFAINFSEQHKIAKRNINHDSQDIEKEWHYFDFARDMGLKGYDLSALPELSHKIIKALPPKKELTSDDVSQSLTSVLRYLTSKQAISSRQISDMDIFEMKARLDQLETEVGLTEGKIEEIREQASRKATMLCTAGSSIVLAQFYLIFAGSFHYLSWDIMEPVCYLMTFGNFTTGFFFYLYMKKDLDLTNFHDIMTHRYTQAACKSQGIDLDAHQAKHDEIARIKDNLQALIL